MEAVGPEEGESTFGLYGLKYFTDVGPARDDRSPTHHEKAYNRPNGCMEHGKGEPGRIISVE